MSISPSDWSKGIGLSIAASIVGASSKLAIRKSWLLQRAQTEESNNDPNLETNDALASSENTQSLLSTRPHDKQWRFYVLRYAGMFGMSVLNPICCVLAMNYASPSILAPFSGLTLVWVIALSGALVGEKPSNCETVAASLILVGEVIVAAFGDHTNDDGVTVHDVVSESNLSPAYCS
jgi:drug/metabolite transporter (DMT)-like permease